MCAVQYKCLFCWTLFGKYDYQRLCLALHLVFRIAIEYVHTCKISQKIKMSQSPNNRWKVMTIAFS